MASNKGYVDAQIAAIPAATDQTPAGTVIYSARSTAPTGYINADGAAISRSTFSVLFAAIGTQFGVGDGATTFNVPDLRGEFIRGWSDGHTVDSGRTLGSNQGDQNLSHNHTGSVTGNGSHGHTYDRSDRGAGTEGGGQGVHDYNASTSVGGNGAHSHGVSINSDGGTEARPRNVALLACIKT